MTIFVIIMFVQVFNRLHKLGLVMSHSSTIRVLEELGSEHDKVVHQWRQELLGSLQVFCLHLSIPNIGYFL